MLQCVDDVESSKCVAVCCSVLQCVAVSCNVLQCVAVCCSMLQCVDDVESSKHVHVREIECMHLCGSERTCVCMCVCMAERERF